MTEPIDYKMLWGEDEPDPEESEDLKTRRNFFDEAQRIINHQDRPDGKE